jgi:glyoxylase-like metal-dependent hydrolase (beta-lactamase superfamily II)
VPIDTDAYEAYALRCGTLPGRKASDWFYRFSVYGLPDVPYAMDCFFWLLRNEARTVLVDCGFEKTRGESRGIRQVSDPLQLLSFFGVGADEVDHIILSHLHFDHVGNLGLFPNATFSIARAELDFWTGPHGSQPAVAAPVEREEVQAVLDLKRQGRLNLVDGSEHLFQGIRVTRVGGHTPGQLITEIATSSGQLVLASDAIHYNDEMRFDRVYNVYTNVEELLQGYAMLRNLAAKPDTTVVAGHDPEVMADFSLVHENCVDLSKRAR